MVCSCAAAGVGNGGNSGGDNSEDDVEGWVWSVCRAAKAQPSLATTSAAEDLRKVRIALKILLL